MDVSVIIVNYNTQALTIRCIESVFTQTIDIEFEVIIIDNASSDDSYITLKNQFPQIKIIKSEENIGFGRACNLGISNSSAKYIFLLNSDTLLLNNAILYFFNFMEANNFDEKLGAIGTVLLDNERKPTTSSDDFPSVSGALKYLKKKFSQLLFEGNRESFDHKNSICKQVDYIIGADLFIPLKVFNKIGLFDPQFFMYFEDTDLQKRMANANLKRVLISGPEIIHLEGGSDLSSTKLSYSRFTLNQRSLQLYMKKHFKGFSYVWFRFFMILIQSAIIFDKRLNSKEKLNAMRLIIAGQ